MASVAESHERVSSSSSGWRKRLVFITCEVPGVSGSNGVAQRRDAGDRERPHRRAVVRGLAGDDLVALGLTDRPEVLPGQLPRRLDRLGAAGGEEDPVQVAGRELGELGGELDRRRVRVAPDREVLERLGLLARGLGELGADRGRAAP